MSFEEGQAFTDQSLNPALLYFAKTGIAERAPRDNTGSVPLRRVKGSVIVCHMNDSLKSLFSILTAENILGCPVVDDNDVYVGTIDTLDLVLFTVDELFKQTNITESTVEQDWDDCFEQTKIFVNTRVCDLLRRKKQQSESLPGRKFINEQLSIPEGHSILFAMEFLAHSGCRRITVSDEKGQVTGIYTQSMAISDITQAMPLLELFGCLPVADCMSKDVISVNMNQKAIDAFRIMAARNITGLAIVDDNGQLTGTLSIRDLRICGNSVEHWPRLFWPIHKYKNETHRIFPNLAPTSHWSTQPVPAGARYVDMEGGVLSDVIFALNDGNLHKILVLDSQGKLVGIVTQTDVIRCLLQALGVLSLQCHK